MGVYSCAMVLSLVRSLGRFLTFVIIVTIAAKLLPDSALLLVELVSTA